MMRWGGSQERDQRHSFRHEKKGWAAAVEGAKHSTRGGVQTEVQTRTDAGVRVVQRTSWEARAGLLAPRLSSPDRNRVSVGVVALPQAS